MIAGVRRVPGARALASQSGTHGFPANSGLAEGLAGVMEATGAYRLCGLLRSRTAGARSIGPELPEDLGGTADAP
jgi:hypothetical protein